MGVARLRCGTPRHAIAVGLAVGILATAGASRASAPAAGLRTGTEQAAACDAASVGPSWPRLAVTVTGMRRIAGNITLTVYGEDPARFLKHAGSLAITRVMLTGPVARLCVAVSRPGTYAIAIYHDENNNHHFDRNFLGLPVEGFGFSNDAPTGLGPPSFAAARITVGPGVQRIAIRLRYL